MELLSDLLQSTVILWRTLNGVLGEMVTDKKWIEVLKNVS